MTTKPNVLIYGRLENRSSLSSHTKSFISLLSQYANVFFYKHNDSDENTIQELKDKYNFKDHDINNKEKFFYDIGIFVDVLSHGDDYKFSYQRFPFELCFIKYCYPVYDGTIPPKDWIDIINYNFDAVISPLESQANSFAVNGLIRPSFSLPFVVEDDFLYSFIPKPTNKFRFGFIGALESRKNIDKILTAFDELFKDHKDVELLIHCTYSFEKNYRNKFFAKLIDLNNPNIFFSGNHLSFQDKNLLLSSFNCLLQPSMSEGYSIVPREALCAGISIILTNISAHLDAVRDLSEQDGIFLVDANKPVPIQHRSLDGRFLGVQYDCDIEDLKNAMIVAYNRRDELSDEQSVNKRKIVSKKYSYEELSKRYGSLVNFDVKKSNQNKITDYGIETNNKDLIEKYTLLPNRSLISKQLTIEDQLRYVLQLHDAGFGSMFNQFVSHLTTKGHVMPDWRLSSLYRTVNSCKNYHEELNLESFCYIGFEDGNLWLKIFDKLPFAQEDYMYNTDLMYNGAVVIDRLDYNYDEIPNITYKEANELYKSPNFYEIRKRISEVIDKNIFLKRRLMDKISNFISQSTKEEEILLSIHFRHQSQGLEQHNNSFPEFDVYINAIENLINNVVKSSPFKIFVASDSHLAIKKCIEHFGNKIIYYNDHIRQSDEEIIRYKNFKKLSKEDAIGFQLLHQYAENKSCNFKLAEDIVTEIYTITKASYLICAPGNVATAAAFINPELNIININQ